MNTNSTIGYLYDLPSPDLTSENRLDMWYVEFYNKKIEDITLLDLIRMLNQDILVDIAVRNAIKYLYEDPLAGEVYDGQLMECLYSVDLNQHKNLLEDIKIMISDTSSRYNELEWISTEDKEEFLNLLRCFHTKVIQCEGTLE